MSKNAIIKQIDAVLKPLGFLRRGAVWNRSSDFSVEVIDVQISRNGDTYTFNAGVLDKAAHEIFWAEGAPDFVEQPDCTVGVRIGDLIDGKDKWWDVGETGSLEQSIQLILAFLKDVHSREKMAQWLEDAEVTKKRYPPPIINLAILQALLGRAEASKSTLNDIESKVSGLWQGRTAKVREQLSV
jgi:Domain of unknown function (DUF4304)